MRPPLEGVLGVGLELGDAAWETPVPGCWGGVRASTGWGNAVWLGVPGGFRAFSLCTTSSLSDC